MTIPLQTLKTYDKTRVDFAIENFAKLENPTEADLNHVRTQASIQCGIEQYRSDTVNMTEKQRRTEEHDSIRMAELMGSAGDPRPASAEYCHCHAIASGWHGEAAAVRAVFAWLMMRIDDPRNGCYLPKNTKARQHMPSWLKNAVPHSRIHRKSYYRWLEQEINFTMTKTLTDLINALKMVRMRLQSGGVPGNILEELNLKEIGR